MYINWHKVLKTNTFLTPKNVQEVQIHVKNKSDNIVDRVESMNFGLIFISTIYFSIMWESGIVV